MTAKYQLITELYWRTGVAVAKNPQVWQSFLSAACRNYKCRFDEQLLIYAQRPNAVAVAELETWNKRFKRWVNKDSKGIAVFDPKGRRNTLKYYFDISDTHEGYYGSHPVPIWQMNERYEQAVIERLSDRFGEVESTGLGSIVKVSTTAKLGGEITHLDHANYASVLFAKECHSTQLLGFGYWHSTMFFQSNITTNIFVYKVFYLTNFVVA